MFVISPFISGEFVSQVIPKSTSKDNLYLYLNVAYVCTVYYESIISITIESDI